MKSKIELVLAAALMVSTAVADNAVKAPLMTQWGEKVTSENCWRENPRPQLIHAGEGNLMTILNGDWDYAVTSATNTPGRPTKWRELRTTNEELNNEKT